MLRTKMFKTNNHFNVFLELILSQQLNEDNDIEDDNVDSYDDDDARVVIK